MKINVNLSSYIMSLESKKDYKPPKVSILEQKQDPLKDVVKISKEANMMRLLDEKEATDDSSNKDLDLNSVGKDNRSAKYKNLTEAALVKLKALQAVDMQVKANQLPPYTLEKGPDGEKYAIKGSAPRDPTAKEDEKTLAEAIGMATIYNVAGSYAAISAASEVSSV